MSDEILTADAELVEMLGDVFAAARESRAPGVGRVSVDRDLWAQLAELGLTRLTGDESAGGSGATWTEGIALVRAAASYGVRLPLVENDLLAGWIADEAGLPATDAVRTVAVVDENGVARHVPWAGAVDAIVVVAGGPGAYRIAETTVSDVRVETGENLVGEPRDTITVDLSAIGGVAVPDETVAQLQRKSALVRAVQVSAALERILALAVEHATVRVQFGRPLARLQAVQHLLADIATEASLARSATEFALVTALADGWSAPDLDTLIAIARSCAGHAASVVVRDAHQVFGAIGTTREHVLHEYTRAALAWRGEHGSVQSWDKKLGEAARAAGRDGLWALITS
ncbi:acyl-CoA dehydrogenase family protein [Microbacterium sp. No. 7]|uniref:acyl-CoA dehydrogenase family protein n=1 Tax=Microbacterium sp. No. 7 TaxID=1714373 RepID=UPI0006ED1E67|nr:acyl-CoA dehydrogenase family protein [Microbacterium sp. No. 7]ALJ21669.1 acyl-CoA dehydrogenase [Microbacterium sp. No. 7]